MNGLIKARLKNGLSPEQMASELCVATKEYLRYEKNVLLMPLPIVKLASLVLKISMQDLLSVGA